MSNKSDSFGEYGYSFQVKLISHLLTDLEFLKRIFDMLEPTMFDSESMALIVKTIKDNYKKHKTRTTSDVFKIKIKELEDPLLKATLMENIKDIYKRVDSVQEDADAIKEEALEFCFNQNLSNTLLECVDLQKQKKYDIIKSKLDAAMKAGISQSIGVDYKESIRQRYEESKRYPVETGFEQIDAIMDGGLGAGELGVYMAPPGSAKTWFLCNLGLSAVKKGLNVLHYSLELEEGYTNRRYDSILSGVKFANLKYHIDDIEHSVKKLPGRLFTRYSPMKTISTDHIAAHVDHMLMIGYKPDLLIIDYADLLKFTFQNKNTNFRTDELLGNVYGELIGIASLYKLPCWTASQSGRASVSKEIVESDTVTGSFEKIMHAHFIMSGSRTLNDKIGNTMRIHIIKNRFGHDGITFPTKVDLDNGHINIYEPESIAGRQAKKEMDNGEAVETQLLRKKYLSLIDEE